MKDKDILPCPFCGSESIAMPQAHRLTCNDCGAGGPALGLSTKENIELWNKRAKAK